MARTLVAAAQQCFVSTLLPVSTWPCTFVAWFKPSALGQAQWLNGVFQANASAWLALEVNNANKVQSFQYDGVNVGVAASVGTVTLGNWHHCGAVMPSNLTRTAYLDGVPTVDSAVGINPITVDRVAVGTLVSGGVTQQFANGSVAELATWAVALTQEEMTALAAGVSPFLIRPDKLVAYYPGLDADGAALFDRSSRGNPVANANGSGRDAHPRIYLPVGVGATLIERPPGLAGTAGLAFAGAAALTLESRFAAAAAIALATVATLSAPGGAMSSSAGVSVATAASLTTSARLTGAAGIRISATASFLPASMLGAAEIRIGTSATLSPSPRATVAEITIEGVDVRGRVRMAGVTIHDVLNDAPNTCSLTIEGAAPAVGQSLRITINEGSRVLFAGQVQSVDQSFKVDPEKVAWAITAIDDTAAANARRPFGTWVDTSATTIAQEITATFAPAFSPAGIAADLPAVSIVFDGSDTFIAALARLATAVGGYTKIEDGTIHLFIVDAAAAPDPIDATHKFLFAPPIKATTDSSQLRTRVYGKGYGEAIQADLAPGESLIPIEHGATFPPAGGRAIASTTPDGAQSQRLVFTGTVLAEGGTLVGPGAAPSTAPIVALAGGAGVESGVHDYAFVFVTAAGRSLPSPRAPITVGQVAPPPTAPTAQAPVAGPGPDPGSHRYYAVFRTASGATLPGPASNAVTTSGAIAAPVLPSPAVSAIEGSGLTLGAGYHYQVTFRRASDGAETSPTYAGQVALFPSNPTQQSAGVRVVTPPAGYQMVLYRTGADEANTPANYREIQTPSLEGPMLDGFMYLVDHSDARKSTALPSANATAIASVPLSAIPVYPSGLVTHVDLYREMNNAGAATARLARSVTNGTTTAIDSTPNSGLGALVPATATAIANRVTVTWPAAPTGTTSIEIYRTPLGSPQLKKVTSVAGAAGGSTTDGTPDAGLTTNAPTDDTSGLEQPKGQVNPGAAELPVAAVTTFRAAGGWVTLGGGQVVRYSGVSAFSLTGIPASGAGAITTTVLYGSQALPAPMLVGVSGVERAIQKGSAIHIWVQRDDLLAQAEQAARAGGDGVIEYLIVDTRRGVDSLAARCDADLALFSRPLVTVAYATRDLKTQSGKTVTVDLASPAIHDTLTIQDVTITDIDTVPGVNPRFAVTASSVRFSLADTLRRLITIPTKIP